MKQATLLKWLGISLAILSVVWVGAFFVLIYVINYLVNKISCF